MNKAIPVIGLSIVAAVSAYALKSQGTLKKISLERTPCFGACPTYKVTLNPDGTVIYEGKRYVEKLGRYEARVNAEDVQRINNIVNKLEFWKLKNKYTARITDMPSAIVTVETSERKKTTDNYGNQAPTELWAIEQLIDKVVAGASEWRKVGDLERH